MKRRKSIGCQTKQPVVYDRKVLFCPQEESMKKTILWKLVLFVGVALLAAPAATGLYHMAIERWSPFDRLILYSYIYWPSYVVGVLLIVLAVVKLRR